MVTVLGAKTSTLEAIKLSKGKQLTFRKPTFLPSLLDNGVQIRILSSTHHLGTGRSFSSSSAYHLESHSTKTAVKGTMGKGSRD